MKRSRLVRTVVPLAAVVVAAGAGAWALRPAGATSAGAGSGGGSGPLRLGGDRVATAAYRTFDGCPALLDHLRSQARPLVGAYGVEGVGVTPVMAERMSSAPSAASEGRAPAAAPADAGAVSGTGTNVQVAGVDEADVTKRSGDLVLTVAGDRNGLTVLRTSGSSAKVVGRLATDFHPDELLVNGSTVLLLGPAGSPQVRPDASTPKRVTSEVAPAPTLTPSTRIVEVSLADPAHPRLVRTLTLDGTSAGARLSGGVLRLALSAQPSRLPFVQPHPTANDPSGSPGPEAGPDPQPRCRRRQHHRAVAAALHADARRRRLHLRHRRGLLPRRRPRPVLRPGHPRAPDVRPGDPGPGPVGRRGRRRERRGALRHERPRLRRHHGVAGWRRPAAPGRGRLRDLGGGPARPRGPHPDPRVRDRRPRPLPGVG